MSNHPDGDCPECQSLKDEREDLKAELEQFHAGYGDVADELEALKASHGRLALAYGDLLLKVNEFLARWDRGGAVLVAVADLHTACAHHERAALAEEGK